MTPESVSDPSFRGWCIVELFGHVTLAGFVSERELGGSKVLQIDIPESARGPAFTKFVTAGSLYGMTPVDEATVRAIVDRRAMQPFSAYELQTAFDKYYETRLKAEMPQIEAELGRRLTGTVDVDAADPSESPGRDDDDDDDDDDGDGHDDDWRN